MLSEKGQDSPVIRAATPWPIILPNTHRTVLTPNRIHMLGSENENTVLSPVFRKKNGIRTSVAARSNLCAAISRTLSGRK